MAGSSSTTTMRGAFMIASPAGSGLAGGQDDVERPRLVGAVRRADGPRLDDQRGADELVLVVVGVALEVQLRHQQVVASVVDGVVDVRRPPGAGADLVAAGVDGLELVVAGLV